MRKFAILSAIAIGTIVLTGCRKTPPANVAATVNGRPITYADVDKQFQMQFAGAQDRPNDDQVAIQKLEIVRGLIDNEILLQRAEKLSLMATDADVEARFNELKAPYTKEEFQRQLDMRKISVDDMKAQIRRDLSVNKLLNKDIASNITITDKEIADFYAANKDSFNLAEPQVRLAQIVVTPGMDAQPLRNLKNDNATNEEAAKQKIATLEARLRQGEDFDMLARNFSEDPNSAPNGGDLGFIPESNLEKADPELRKYLAMLQPGQTSRVIRMQQDYRILKVISREPSGQRDLNDPKVQQSIREQLMNRKDQLLRAAYYEVARNEAEVVNHYAASITANKGITK
jgi:peptidyl-prolyl cis-trans isomerase SurA